MPLPYDRNSRASILDWAQRLIGKTLREVIPDVSVHGDGAANKGDFGQLVERGYFLYEPNSSSEPDFHEVSIELKTTPLKETKSKTLVPKERLVLGMIDYMTLDCEEWENSSFLAKNSSLLIVFYLWSPNRSLLDYPIVTVRLWEFPEEDLRIIREDWEKIVSKVRRGLAHEISGGDTLYLEACVKAATGSVTRAQPHSTIPAKPRAFALKPSYMKTVLSRGEDLQPVMRAGLPESLSFEEMVAARFDPYIGYSSEELADMFGIKTRPKHLNDMITRRILGVGEHKKVEEFEKAGVQVKTIRLRPSGMPKEAVSFPAFKYVELVEACWEDSELYEALSKRFFFVIYRLSSDGVARLESVRFWTMPQSDLDLHARNAFNSAVEAVREGKLEYLPKSTDNPCCHVRPHARDNNDTYPLPSGGSAPKKSFWLNSKYLAEQLKDPPRGV